MDRKYNLSSKRRVKCRNTQEVLKRSEGRKEQLLWGPEALLALSVESSQHLP